MKIIKKENQDNKIKYTIQVDEKEWEEYQKHSFASLSKSVFLPGFRKGKVPLNLLKEKISLQEIINNCLRKVINEQYKKLISDKQFDNENAIEDALAIDVIKANEKELEIIYEFEKYPNITLPNYKNIKLSYKKELATDDDVQRELNYLTKNDTMLSPKQTQVIEKGDMVNFDFKGFIDNKPFAGGESKGYELEIGSNNFIPGFEEKMIGLKKDDTKTIEVTFPKDYHAKDMANKKANFELKINDVKTIIKPEINREFVEKLKIPNVNDEKTLKEFIKKQITDQKNYYNRQQAITSISHFLMKQSKLDYVPKTLLDNEIKRLNDDTNKKASESNLSRDEYIYKTLGYKEITAYDQKVLENAKNNLTLVMSLEKIIEDLKLDVSQKELNDHLEKMTKIYGMKLEDLKARLNNNFEGIKTFILQEKVFDKLIELNTK
ncbi:MAG: trigger factor [Mycoplasmataceae bacterium]|nr:trigger factor [Mycoplasmataceae bacterium]